MNYYVICRNGDKNRCVGYYGECSIAEAETFNDYNDAYAYMSGLDPNVYWTILTVDENGEVIDDNNEANIDEDNDMTDFPGTFDDFDDTEEMLGQPGLSTEIDNPVGGNTFNPDIEEGDFIEDEGFSPEDDFEQELITESAEQQINPEAADFDYINLFGDNLFEAEAEKSSDPIKGPYEIRLVTNNQDDKDTLKAIKAAIKKGAPINLVKYSTDDYSAFGDEEALKPFEIEPEGWHESRYYSAGGYYDRRGIQKTPAKWLDTHTKDEGSYSLGNFIPNGRSANPEFGKWHDRMENELGIGNHRWNKGPHADRADRYRKFAKEHDIDFDIGGNYGKNRFWPRQNSILNLADAGNEEAKAWLEKNPMPDVLAPEDYEEPGQGPLFALYSDGGNCYSSHDDGNWYWTTNWSDYDGDFQTSAELRKRLRRASDNMASRNYREYCPGSGRIEVYSSPEKFIAACKKHGFTPNLKDLEFDIEEYFPDFKA